MIDSTLTGIAGGGILTYLVIQIKDSLKNVEAHTKNICDKVRLIK